MFSILLAAGLLPPFLKPYCLKRVDKGISVCRKYGHFCQVKFDSSRRSFGQRENSCKIYLSARITRSTVVILKANRNDNKRQLSEQYHCSFVQHGHYHCSYKALTS
jgi:hypothetical protein